jgi:hypothetical protein
MTDTQPPPAWHGPGSAQDWRPIPDPTALTDAAIERATQQFRRELDALRELLEDRIISQIHAREMTLTAIRETFEARLAGMDTAAVGRIKVSDMIPAQIREEVGHLRRLHEIRFDSITLQFAERDVRTEQAATASASALAAALQAAKEAVFEQAQAAARAAEKTELSFTKQIDQIGLRIDTVTKGYDDRLTELKERIDRGEGQNVAIGETRTEIRAERADQRLSQGAIVSLVVALVIIAGFVITLITLHT